MMKNNQIINKIKSENLNENKNIRWNSTRARESYKETKEQESKNYNRT